MNTEKRKTKKEKMLCHHRNIRVSQPFANRIDRIVANSGFKEADVLRQCMEAGIGPVEERLKALAALKS